MRPAKLAALCSGLGFPGLGYLFIGQRLRGWIVIGLLTACLIALLMAATEAARPIAEAILSGQLQPDFSSILGAVHEAKGKAMSAARGAVWGLVILWLFSTVDGYRLGRRLEREAGKPRDE
ncbi:MAG: hypothetical protein QM776_04050 [Rhodocyclaceae bacterium]